MPAKDLTKPHFVSLIIPVYKQEKTIVRDIKRIKGVLDTIRYPHEINVVIDGILDKSLTRCAL
jgi:putative effector of murein hydrolase